MLGPTPAQRKQWNDQGFLILEGAIGDAELERLRKPFDHWAEQCREGWFERVEAGEEAPTYYDIPDPLEKDVVFVDLVDHPAYCGLLEDFTDGELLFHTAQLRTVPPWPLSYMRWHRDDPDNDALLIKVQIYIDDVPPGGGEFAYVPGSHKPDAARYRPPQRNESMPGHRALPGKAGTAIVFHAYGCHTAMDNPSRTPIKSVILSYEKGVPERIRTEAFAAIAHHCTTPKRRALFGLEP